MERAENARPCARARRRAPSLTDELISGMRSVPVIVQAPGPGGASAGSWPPIYIRRKFKNAPCPPSRDDERRGSSLHFVMDVALMADALHGRSLRNRRRSVSSHHVFMSRSSKVVPAAFQALPSLSVTSAAAVMRWGAWFAANN